MPKKVPIMLGFEWTAGQFRGLQTLPAISTIIKISKRPVAARVRVTSRIRRLASPWRYSITGSPANVFDQSTFESWQHRPALVPCDAKFYGYSASKPIKILSWFDAMVKHGAKPDQGQILKQECLSCCSIAWDLRLLTINSVARSDEQFVERTYEGTLHLRPVQATVNPIKRGPRTISTETVVKCGRNFIFNYISRKT